MIRTGSTLIVATRNRGKTEEFREAFAALGVRVLDLNEFESVPPVAETGTTFAENALLKAQATAELLGLPTLADDSGLCVDALGGAPGVYSARYAGEHAGDADNNAKLLRELAAAEKAEAAGSGSPADTGAGSPADAGSGSPAVFGPARFVSVLVLYEPSAGSFLEAEGVVEGFILKEPRGTGGFGYDPLFWLPEAEITP